MKKRIFSLLATLVVAISVLIGVSLTANAADSDGLAGHSINLAENVTLKMDVAIAAPTAGAYAKITLPGGKFDTEQLVATAPKNGDNYVFYAEVAVKDLAKNVGIEICNADGTTLVAYDETSALAYCEQYLANPDEIEFNGLVNKLMDYAYAADYYFDKTKAADSAASADFSGVADAKKGGTLPAGITHRSVTLLLESETTIRHYFELASGKYIENYTFFVDLDKDGKCDLNERLTPRDKTNADGTVVYYVEIRDLTPNMLDTVYTVGVTGKADGLTYTYDYGVLTYAKRSYAKSDIDTKNLAAAILAYNTEAGELEGTITFNENGGSAVADMTYKYGIETPIVAPTTLSGSVFVGWYDENGVKYESIPASQTGELDLTARWTKSESEIFAKDSEESGITYSRLINCANHTAENAHENGVCKTCGYCTDKNEDVCPFYIGGSNASTCSLCNQAYVKSVSSQLFTINDYRYGFANSVTLANGEKTILTSISGGSSYFNTAFPSNSDNLYKTVTAEGGSKLIFLQFNVGRPTEEQINEALEGTNFVQIENGTFDPYTSQTTLAFRIGNTTTFYSEALVQVKGTSLIVGSNEIKNVIPVGEVATFTVALDFSNVKPDDGAADEIGVYAYDNNGTLLGRGIGSTKAGCDINQYTNKTLGQMRLTSEGSILFDGYRVYSVLDNNTIVYPADVTLPENAPTAHTYGERTVLPTPTKAGYRFAGWYLDEELTQPIEAIPANESDRVSVYAKWYKIYTDEHFEDKTYTNLSCTGTASYDVIDGKLHWTATKTYTTVKLTTNDIRDAESDVFSVILKIEKPQDSNLFGMTLSMQETKDLQANIMKINASNTVIPGNSKTPELMQITEEGATVVVTVDFDKGLIFIYDGNGVLLHETELSIPNGSTATTTKEWRKQLRDTFNLRLDNTSTDGGAVIDSFTVTEGYYFE